jgi:hypothetical protein
VATSLSQKLFGVWVDVSLVHSVMKYFVRDVHKLALPQTNKL